MRVYLLESSSSVTNTQLELLWLVIVPQIFGVGSSMTAQTFLPLFKYSTIAQGMMLFSTTLFTSKIAQLGSFFHKN